MKNNSFCKILYPVMIVLFLVNFDRISADNSFSIKNTYTELNKSITEAISKEKKNLTDLIDQLKKLRNSKQKTSYEINAYKVTYSTHVNLVLLPEIQLKSLEKAKLENQTSVNEISAKLKEMNPFLDSIKQLKVKTDEQIKINRKQLKEIYRLRLKRKEARSLAGKTAVLIRITGQKERILKSLIKLQSNTINEYESILKQMKEFSVKLDKNIEQYKKNILFKRKKSIFFQSGWKQIKEDINQIEKLTKNFFSLDFWSKELRFIKNAGNLFIASFIFLLLFLQILLFRLKRFLNKLINEEYIKENFWLYSPLFILSRSNYLFGSTLFFFLYINFVPVQIETPLIVMVLDILFIWLFTKWFCLFIKAVVTEERYTKFIKTAVHIRKIIYFIRYFAVLHCITSWLYDENSSIFIITRFLFLITLYILSILFWGFFQKRVLSDIEEKSDIIKINSIVFACKSLNYGVIITAVVLELTGFGALSLYWMKSLGKFSVVLLWSFLIFRFLGELSPIVVEKNRSDSDEFYPAKFPVKWLTIQIMTLFWLAGSLIGFVFSFGGKQTVLMNIYKWLQHPIQIGSMKFSFLGIIFAIMILIFTHMIVRFWRELFQLKFLNKSGFDTGVQESIKTISIYFIWFFGILFAMNAVGFNSTSITVAFGALGIGLGFGLQNIFNNFISGIILLFERPIQVGDDIEINGTWATVKKINVRSTVVQTYDNATLIIPNSDFISNQVTNWSFKDKRLRRNVEVGVAYGSDIELVRKVLLEIADNTARVLKNPKPDVIFMNFGDSALIFKLRFWTRVEYFYQIETSIRFEIDRLFKENNIEISFPQRDIHIRSIDPEIKFTKENNK